jgi:hypothetical protein
VVGITILAVVGIYVGVVGWLVTSVVKSNWGRVAVVMTALAIPFWDWPYGYYNFRHTCDREGGLRLYEKFEPTTHVFFDYPIHPESVIRHGFQTVEYRSGSEVRRYSAGERTTSIHKSPVSLIKLSVIPNQEAKANLIRRDYIATRISDSRLLAKYSDFRWEGLWWQRAIAPLLGDGGRCHFPNEQPLLSVMAHGNK